MTKHALAGLALLLTLCLNPVFCETIIPGEGLQAEGNGEWQTAVSIYLDALLKTPNRVDLWLRVASIEHHLKHDALTINAYRHALSYQPNNPALHKTLSELYAGANQPVNALLEINEAIKLKPNDLDYLAARAKIANWNNQYGMAMESEKRILALSPTNKQALEGLSLIESILKKSEVMPASKPISALDQLINQSNEAALLHHYDNAAIYMKKAIALYPNDAMLYKNLAEIYATAQQPAQALLAINHALVITPNNLNYLRTRAILAAWNSDKTQTLDSYDRILQLKPDDEDALLNRAHTLAWLARTDAALSAYQDLLSLYPTSTEGWIQYAEALSWTSNYLGSFDALRHYQQLKGETQRYCEVKARILALVGRFKSALAINNPLVNKEPLNSYVLSTEVTALIRANQITKALIYLKKLDQNELHATRITANPSAGPSPSERREVKSKSTESSIKNMTLLPLRSNINLEGDYTSASDTTRIQDFPVSAQYFLSPTTSLLFQGLYERATAMPSSGLGPVDGNKHSILDDSAKIGLTTQVESLNLKGLVGGLHIQGKNNHGIYYAALNTNLGEKAQVTFESLHDLYRPYLVPQTPKLISLQIMETRFATSLQWQPFVQKYLNATLSYSELTDNNSYTHINVWPKARVYNSQHWLVTVGVDGDFWRYRRRATDGYYSPKVFNGYEGTVELYYAQSENIGYSLSGGFGAQKDELLPHYFYEEDLAIQMFMGIFTDWQLQVKAGYTLRENNIKTYYCWTTGATLTRRF